jgi:hypothetical protein
MLWRVWLPLSLAALMAACGVEQEPVPEEPGAAVQALDGATCRPTAPPPVGAGDQASCKGPWEYRPLCAKDAPNSACGVAGYHQTTCWRDSICEDRSFGSRVRETQTHVGTGKLTVYSTRECDYSVKPPCTTTSSTSYQKTCHQVAQDLVHILRSQGKEDPAYPLFVASVTATGRTQTGSAVLNNTRELYRTATYYDEGCSVQVGNVVTAWNSGRAPACADEPYACNDLSRPIYNSCRTPNNGWEEDPARCDGLSGYGKRSSAPDVTLATLKQQDPNADTRLTQGLLNRPVCLSGDTISFDSVQAKYDAVFGPVGGVPAGVDGPRLRYEQARAGKLLFELKGDSAELDDTERANLRALYTSHPEQNRVQRHEAQVNGNWGLGSPFGGIAPETFSARWTGFVQVPTAGTYTFSTLSDDGARLYVNNVLVVDRWVDQGAQYADGTITLNPGRYPIRMEYYENGGGAVAQLLWTPPGTTGRQPVPAANLFRASTGTTTGVLAEYFDDTNFTSDACVNTWTPPVIDGTCAGIDAVNATYAMCRMMARPHVRGQVVSLVLDACNGALAAANATSCGAGRYDALHAELMGTLSSKVVALPLPTDAAARQEALRVRLTSLGTWYATAVSSDPAARTRDAFWNDVNARVGAFWKGVHGSVLDVSGYTAANLPADLEARIERDYSAAEREALLVALPASGALPLPGAPLLLLLHDGLRGGAERLRFGALAHDLGCRIEGCAGGTPRTSTSQLWELFGTVHARAELQAALANATLVDEAWKDVFTRIEARHPDLVAAVASAFGTPVPGTELGVRELMVTRFFLGGADVFPGVAAPLATLVREANLRTEGFRSTGLLMLRERNLLDKGMDNVLHAGMTEDTQAIAINNAFKAIEELKALAEGYSAARTDLAVKLLDQMRQETLTARMGEQLQLEYRRYLNSGLDLAGLRHRLALEDARLGGFVAALVTGANNAISEGHLAPAMQPQGSPASARVWVSAKGARFLGGEPSEADSLSGMAAPVDDTPASLVWKMSANAGQLVDVNVTGTYAPVCAMGTGSKRTDGTDISIGTLETREGKLVPVLTGPEGYLISLNGSTYQARANDSLYESGSYTRESDSETTCGGFRLEVPVPFISAAGFGSVTSCTATESGSSSSRTRRSTTSAGQDTRTAASYATGLRLSRTPFPDAPAGSLLLVEARRTGAPPTRKDVLDVHVLRNPSSTVLVKEDADLYLVVNDRGACTSEADGTNRLEVRVQRWETAGTLMPTVLTAMQAARAYLEGETESYLAQGRVSPQELAALRLEAFEKLPEFCNQATACDVSKLPTRLAGIFTAWVERDLATLERKAHIRGAVREQELATLQLQALSNELGGARTDLRLRRLLPGWALRNLQGEHLRAKSVEVARRVLEDLLPIIHLRYPSVLAGLNASEPALHAKLDALTERAWADGPLAQADNLYSVVLALKTPLQQARERANISQVGQQFPVVGAYFARRTVAQGWGVDAVGKTVDETRADEVWAQFEDPDTRQVTFDVRPDDLYQLGGGKGVLLCKWTAPVVRSMAIYFVRSDWSTPGTFNTGLYIDSQTEGKLTFPTPQGEETYFQLNADWLPTGMRVIGGTREEAETHFRASAAAARVGNGLSPFLSVEISKLALDGYFKDANYLQNAEGVMVMFEVDPKPVTDRLTWMRSCPPE